MNGAANSGEGNWHPSFIIIGAVKAATTWTLEQLQVNPSIYMPDPEPHYFSSEYGRGEQYYRNFFTEAAGSGRLLGEKSADYLAHPDAARRMAAMLPEARLIVQLRNPVERAYSDYKMLYRRGVVSGPPEEYLASLNSAQPRFLNDGLYAAHLERWLDHFPSDQIQACLFEDVKQRPRETIEAISDYLGVDPVFSVEQARKKANDGSEAFLPLAVRKTFAPLKSAVAPLRGKAWFETTRGLLARKIVYPAFSADLRARLCDFFADDVEKLGRMLRRDLTQWLEFHEEEGSIANRAPPPTNDRLVGVRTR